MTTFIHSQLNACTQYAPWFVRALSCQIWQNRDESDPKAKWPSTSRRLSQSARPLVARLLSRESLLIIAHLPAVRDDQIFVSPLSYRGNYISAALHVGRPPRGAESESSVQFLEQRAYRFECWWVLTYVVCLLALVMCHFHICRYLTAGFLEKDDTIPLLLALQEGGADVSAV